MIMHGSRMENHQHAAKSKSQIDRRTQASKFLKDLDELRVFDNRLVSLRRIPTAFFLPPPFFFGS